MLAASGMRYLLLAVIYLYRKCISPYKGFACAYRIHTGGASCSTHGLRVVERHGVQKGIALIRRRLQRCSHVYRSHAAKPLARDRSMRFGRRQSGFCDCACDGGDLASCACDGLGNCGSAGDCGSWGKRKKDEKKSKIAWR